MKHSPAPWKVIVHDYDEDGNYIPKEVPYGYRSGEFGGNPYIVDANGETVAGNDEYHAFSTPENVRLMVHAPELLEALKDLLYDLDTVDSYALNETVRPIWEDIDRAKAIIAKAEGA
jgi:hypothetical protein